MEIVEVKLLDGVIYTKPSDIVPLSNIGVVLTIKNLPLFNKKEEVSKCI